MLAVYATGENQIGTARAALPPYEPIVATDNWLRFEHAAPSADCAVVVLQWLSDEPAFARLADWKAHCPFQPVVLVTSKDADNARRLKDMMVEEVVWLGDVPLGLWPAVRRANARGFLKRVAHRIEEAHHLGTPLRRALVLAARSTRPPHTVTRLAEAAGCDRRTLWRHWHRAFDDVPPIRLEDFLDWLLLLRAAAYKTPRHGWAAIAAELGTHQHTIAHLATRLLGTTLSGLTHFTQPELATRFTEHALDQLVTSDR